MDVVGGAVAAVTARSPIAFGLSLLAGAATSIGPCAAPRYVALASLMSASRSSSTWRVAAFIAGVLSGSATLVLASRSIVIAASSSSLTYLCLACSFFALGIWVAVQPDHRCNRAPFSMGASLFLGAATTVLVSPCCTPVFIALGAIGASSTSPWFALGAAVSFSAGHLAGLFVSIVLARRISPRLKIQLGTAPQTVSAGLMVALGCYYAVLA